MAVQYSTVCAYIYHISFIHWWDFPGKNTGVGCHFLLQRIFLTQGSTQVSGIVGRWFTIWATREVLLLSSVQFSRSVVSNFLRPHGLQHARPPCPSTTPGVYPDSCPLSQWCHPIISFCHPLLPPSIFPSIRVFSNDSVLCVMWPKYWSFRFNISPSNEHSGLISFSVGSHVRHYWQNGGTVPNPSLHPAGTVLGWGS